MRNLLFFLLSLPGALPAATFTVDTTADLNLVACTAAANDCSLRGAINASNGVAGFDTVAFNIPMSDAGCTPATGVCRITLASVIDNLFVDSNVLIDGYTQPGAQPNTIPAESGGLNSVLKIEIVRSAVGGHSAFNTNSTGFTFILRGVAISGFSGTSAIGYVGGFGTAYLIEGNYLGTDASGNAVPVRNGSAVALSNSAHRIGGLLPAQRNLISNNDTGIVGLSDALTIQGNLIGTNRDGTQAIPNIDGVRGQGGSLIVGGSVPGARNVISGNTRGIITGASLSSALVQGNLIGTDASGSLPLGNATNGVELGNTVALIGGELPPEANVIAFNGTQGVATRGSRGRVIGNRMFGNGQLGIGNPGDNGSTNNRRPNDPGDPDGPSNNGQNFAEISAFAINGSNAELMYAVDSTATNSVYPLRVEFYKADGDEGRDFIGSDSYSAAQAQSVKSITLPIAPGVALGSADVIVATATDANGNTSEFSFSPATLSIENPAPSACANNDAIFCNGFESGAQAALRVRVNAVAAAGAFRPNGTVSVSDDRGHSCTLTLAATASALVSAGECLLIGSGASGPISVSATLGTFNSAFGSANGGNVTVSVIFTIP